MENLEIGNKVKVTDKFFKDAHIGIITEIEICYFRIMLADGNTMTYHWNNVENAEIIE